MSDEPEQKPPSCPDCGADIPKDTPEGMCPQCLLGGGLDPATLSGDDAAGPDAKTIASSLAAYSLKPQEPTQAGTKIDRYKLLKPIGEGGFGTVYLAEQTEPVKRRVALKVIKAGMDSKEVIARFEAERQALALMEHPNIAHVHDAGTTDSGRPYFVMEWVQGVPITKYCDDQKLDTRARLELFLDVCSAVQHAHQKGIIHRDLKPSNILVSAQNEEPMVKVIDFGIAKAISMELTEKTVFTELGRMIGTPQYMSPEQAHLNVLDLDTRSDIHSLGVILYELLTGRTPLDQEKLRSAGYAEIQSMIRNELPVKPSACITSLGERLPSVAARRGTEPGKLQRKLRGDLDWIVMMALEKDRTRRYQSTNGLAVDIRRFLNDEPVSASPPSATYRLVQFTKRHRAGAIWTTAIASVVFVAMIVIFVLYLDLRQKAKIARITEWELNLSTADRLRTDKSEPGRRFKALEILDPLTKIPPGIDKVDSTRLPARKRLRDTVISCLAVPDMQTVLEWQTGPDHARDSMVAGNRSLKRYAHTFPDGRIGIYRSSKPSEPLMTLNGEGGAVRGVLKFGPDDKFLAAAYDTGDGNDPKLKLWHLDPKSQSAVDAGSAISTAFTFFPDGKRCAVGRPDSKIEVIDCKSGENRGEFEISAVPHSISVSKDGKFLAVSMPGANEVVIINVADGKTVTTLGCEEPRALAWGPDDSLAVCTRTFLAVWRGRDWLLENPVRLELRPETGVVEDAVAWSPDGRLLASQSRRDNRCRFWDPTQGGSARCWHKGTCGGLQFSKDGIKLGIFRDGETLSLVEVASGDVCRRGRGHTGESGIYDGVWNRDGSFPAGTLLATSGFDGVRLWNREGLHLGHIRIENARGIAYSSNSLFVASAGGLFEWAMEKDPSGDELVRFRAGKPIGNFLDCEQASLSPNGKWLAVAARRSDGKGKNTKLWLIDLEDQNKIVPLAKSEGVTTCTISGDGLWLAAGKKNGAVFVWAMPENGAPNMKLNPLKELEVNGSDPARVAFSPLPRNLKNGQPTGDRVKWLVTGDAKEYRFWNTSSWKLEEDKSIPSNMGEANGQLAFSSRGTALAIAVEGDEMKVFSLPTDKSSSPEEMSSPDFDQEIPLCFSPYGRILVTAKPTGLIFFWKLDDLRPQLKGMELDWDLLEFPKTQKFRLVKEVVPAVILPPVEEE